MNASQRREYPISQGSDERLPLLALLALAGIAGCNASGPEPPFETAYSAMGAAIK